MSHSAKEGALKVSPGSTLGALLRSMRPKQWVKNVFVFIAIAFSEGRLWRQPEQLAVAIGAFLTFCACSSAIYLLNDLVDIEKDRAHPKKRHRPLASGQLSIPVAIIAALVLGVAVLISTYLLDFRSGSADYGFLIVILTYILVQGLLYSFWLKHVVILDIFIIASGFVLRAIAGAVVLDIPITPWLLVCVGLLSLFLGLGKRRAELVLLGEGASSHRRILEEYSLPMVDQMIGIVTSATIMAYTLFTYTSETLQREPYPVMMATVPLVVYAIFRYIYLIHRHNEGGSPEELALKDLPLAVSIILYGLMVLVLMAWFPK